MAMPWSITLSSAWRKSRKVAWRGFRLAPCGSRHTADITASRFLPERRTTPLPPRPGAVAIAAIGKESKSMLRLKKQKKKKNKQHREILRRGHQQKSPHGCAGFVGQINRCYAGFPPWIFCVITHCWVMDRMLLTTQYSTSPAGKKKNMTEKMIGMNIITLAWTGSGGVGFSLVCTNIETAMMTGRM